MQHDTAVFLVSEDVKAVTCEYEPDGKTYTFKSLIPNLKKDDYVVIPTDTRHGFTVVKVVDPDIEIDLEGNFGTTGLKWLASRFDPAEYAKVLANETLAIETIRKAEKKRKRRELRDDLNDLTGGALDGLKLAAPIDDAVDPTNPNA